MAAIKFYAIGLGAVLAVRVGGGAPVELREGDRPGETTRVKIELKAEGLYLPAAAPGASKAEVPKPLALKVESKLEFFERRLRADAAGRPGRVVRRVVRAGSAVNGEVRPLAAVIRPGGRHSGRRAEGRGGGRVQPGGASDAVGAGAGPGAGRPAGPGGALARSARSGWGTAGRSRTPPRGRSRRMTRSRPTRSRRPWRPSTAARRGSGSGARSAARCSAARG